MELERECLVLESVEDNEAISNINSERLDTNTAEHQVANNGRRVAEQNHVLSETNGKGIEAVEEAGTMLPVEDMKSTSVLSTPKGKGLRKWRRIKREARKDGDNKIDTSKMLLKRGFSYSGNNPAKPGQFSAGAMQKSEESTSSTMAFVRSPDRLFDCFGAIGDSGVVLGPALMAGTDSENSEDQSSKSSTAASAPKMRYTKPVVVKHACDKNWVNLSGNSSGNSVQLGQRGKNKMESSKKPRGERDKLEMENSHSSMESDSRSSNFVFMQGIDFVTGDGTKESRPMNYYRENSDEAEDSEQKESKDFWASYSRENSGGFGDFSHEGLATKLSWVAKNEKSESHGMSTDFDRLTESIFTLQTAQEVLEKEVQKFKELGKEDVVDDPLGDGSRPLEFASVDHGPTTSDGWQSVDGHTETELEGLFKQKIEAEVEFLVISKAVKNHKTAAQIDLLEEQKALAKTQAEMVNKLGYARKKAALYKCEDESLQNCSENIVGTDETVKLPKEVFKYTWCFFLQLVLLLLVRRFVLELSPHHAGVVPT